MSSSKAKSYDEAVALLVDLRELAVREGEEVGFGRRVEELRQAHSRERNFLSKLGEAGIAVMRG